MPTGQIYANPLTGNSYRHILKRSLFRRTPTIVPTVAITCSTIPLDVTSPPISKGALAELLLCLPDPQVSDSFLMYQPNYLFSQPFGGTNCVQRGCSRPVIHL